MGKRTLWGAVYAGVLIGIFGFTTFAPIALAMRLSGRDELRLKIKNKSSYYKI